MMGGLGAHEYMAPCAAGENEVALAPGYAANVEVASADSRGRSSCCLALASPEEVPTPGLTTVDAVARALEVRARRAAEGLSGRRRRPRLRLVMLRGDHRVNEIKLRAALRARTSAPASAEEVQAQLGPPGFIGPVGARRPDPARRGGPRPAHM